MVVVGADDAGADHAGADQDAAPRATVALGVGARDPVTGAVTGAVTIGPDVAGAASGAGSLDGEATSVTSAPAGETTFAEDPEDHSRSRSSSGTHTMVATTASVRVRCTVEGVEDRVGAFARGQDRLGPMRWTRVGALPLTPPGATGSP